MPSEFLRADCIFPAPMMTETERQKRVAEYRLGVWANGCVVEKEWRVHNPVFDKKGEKSTTMMRIRPAQTEDEVDFIVKALGVTGLNEDRGV